MKRKEKKIVKENKLNLYNLNFPLYNLIVKYGISHLYLAKQLYPAEWDKISDTTLTGRLRNKLDGNGSILPSEYTDLINIMSEMADSMKVNLDRAIEIRNQQRQEKIQVLLEGLDEETRKELKKNL